MIIDMDMDKCHGMMENHIKDNGLMEYKKMLKLNLIIIQLNLIIIQILIIDIIHLVIDSLFKKYQLKIKKEKKINYLS
jgi:hypothetical protein